MSGADWITGQFNAAGYALIACVVIGPLALVGALCWFTFTDWLDERRWQRRSSRPAGGYPPIPNPLPPPPAPPPWRDTARRKGEV